jgi:hypothetical protein
MQMRNAEGERWSRNGGGGMEHFQHAQCAAKTAGWRSEMADRGGGGGMAGGGEGGADRKKKWISRG